MNSFDFVTWTQPQDPTRDDVISMDGNVVAFEDEDTRRWLVSSISQAAESGIRQELPDGGFLARGPFIGVAEIPVQSVSPEFHPRVTIAVSYAPDRENRATAATICEDVVRTSLLAGHLTDTETVRPIVLNLLNPTSQVHRGGVLNRAKRLWARLVRWIRDGIGRRS
jgi:hypothetical protein